VVVMDAVIVVAAAALAAGYLPGRLRSGSTRATGGRSVRFTGAWVRGGAVRQPVVVLVHALSRRWRPSCWTTSSSYEGRTSAAVV
jgi:hypothetical protein